jgi:putative transcriptional regulator
MIPERLARRRPGFRRFLAIAAAAAWLQGAADPAQSTRTNTLSAGRLLVASRDLLDPNFARTVVLLVRYDEDSVVGLIINRKTNVPIARAFPELPESAKGRSDPIYSGGPVERAVATSLLRSRVKPEGADKVFADVSLVSSKSLLDKTMRAGTEPGTFRLYAGYSGWTAEQLAREVELGGWYIFDGDASMVFDPDPESMWSRLIRKTEQRIASGYRLR